MLLHLPDEAATLALGETLGRALARAMNNAKRPAALLLSGPLGSGKTTLVRALVSVLPGAGQAEVASPSFNIVNHYPTTPKVAHFDLYRVAGPAPEEFVELCETPDVLVIAEWAENILRADWPEEALHLAWQPVPSGRALKISALGKAASVLLQDLAPALNHWQQGS